MSRRALIAIVAAAVLLGAGGVLYAFGTPQAPQTATPASPAADSSEPNVTSSEAEVQTAEKPGDQPSGTGVPAPDPSAPLAIEIPGCVCHSDDPGIVEEHAAYRMNQCAGCHAGGVPTGQ